MLMAVSKAKRSAPFAGLEHADLPSLVMKEINSLTHSCMHSLASLAILAFSGSACFMMRATGAKFRMLASYTSCLSALEDDPRPSPGDLEREERSRDMGKGGENGQRRYVICDLREAPISRDGLQGFKLLLLLLFFFSGRVRAVATVVSFFEREACEGRGGVCRQ